MNPLLLTDYYKVNHYRMYPEGTSKIYSNLTPRKARSGSIKEIVVFGIQYFIKDVLIEKWNKDFFEKPKDVVIAEYKRMMDFTLGAGAVEMGHIEQLWDLQYLPLQIKALPEGSLCPIGVPCMTITNTVDHAYWLVNYLETVLSANVWGPITSATIAHQYRKLLDAYAMETTGDISFVDWQGHDFSARGLYGTEAMMMSGMGHLLSFKGTDTIPAIFAHEKYYNANVEKELVGSSVPATEHSVMCMGSKDGEIDTFERLMDLYPTGILSVVSDTWNLWDVLTKFLPELKEKVLARDGKLVIRPDSGDPVDIICGSIITPIWDGEKYLPESKGVIELLWDVFGGTVNEQGYKVLDSHVGAIYGDSITLARAEEICKRLKEKGFASTNIVLGIGSFTYQYNTRDTFGFAVKATYGEVKHYKMSGVSVDELEIFKDPITDDGTKKSAKGLLRVEEVASPTGGTVYKLIDQVTKEMEQGGALETVFLDGKLTKDQSLSEIRERLAKNYKYEQRESYQGVTETN